MMFGVAQEPETGTVGTGFPETDSGTGITGTVFQGTKPGTFLVNGTETQ